MNNESAAQQEEQAEQEKQEEQHEEQRQEKQQEEEKQEEQQEGQQEESKQEEQKEEQQQESPNTGTTQTTTKVPVKRVVEETKSAGTVYKYGIIKYDIITNEYMTYSDGSKELLSSSSYPIYDSTNYNATDAQLKSEADATAAAYMSYYQEVLRLVNEIRAQAGVDPLTLDLALCKAASMRALEMDYNNEMSHTRPSGEACWSVLQFYGISYSACGENVAAGQPSAAAVVNAWKNSKGHYENMVNPAYTKLGVGYSKTGVGNYGHYWCQLFSN